MIVKKVKNLHLTIQIMFADELIVSFYATTAS